jgi:protein transport protein SEC61 subunit gamma-like protein
MDEENKEQPQASNEQPVQQTAPVAAETVEEPVEEVQEATEETSTEEKPSLSIPKFKLNVKGIPAKIINTLHEFRRVIIVSRKPDMEEISTISKIAGIGIAIMGLIGFAIQIIFQLAIRGGV